MIHISRQVDYACQLIKRLAREPDGGCVSLPHYSKESNISLLFLQKIARRLRQSGIIVAHKGPGGGYRLGDAPENITLKRIIDAIEGPYLLISCLGKDGCCRQSACATRSLWSNLNERVVRLLEETTMKG